MVNIVIIFLGLLFGLLNAQNDSFNETEVVFFSTQFHSTNFITINNYKIEIEITITYSCDSNVTNTTICPDYQLIEDELILFFNDKLDEEYIYTDFTITSNNNQLIITLTIYTNDMDDHDELTQNIGTTDFNDEIQDYLDDIDGFDVESVETANITDDPDDGNGDDDSLDWLDPLNYELYQWIVVGVILFFLILIIIGCSWWCCCRNKKDKNGDFMKNPHRYDSEFPGAEMQSFSTVKSPNRNQGVIFVE